MYLPRQVSQRASDAVCPDSQDNQQGSHHEEATGQQASRC
jgi:hypothetical protein